MYSFHSHPPKDFTQLEESAFQFPTLPPILASTQVGEREHFLSAMLLTGWLPKLRKYTYKPFS